MHYPVSRRLALRGKVTRTSGVPGKRVGGHADHHLLNELVDGRAGKDPDPHHKGGAARRGFTLVQLHAIAVAYV